MILDNSYKKLSLFVILDAYATKNAIEHLLDKENKETATENFLKTCRNKKRTLAKIESYTTKYNKELGYINEFLNDQENIHWLIVGIKKEYFDKNLPKHKRKLKWFDNVYRHPFDHSLFLSSEA